MEQEFARRATVLHTVFSANWSLGKTTGTLRHHEPPVSTSIVDQANKVVARP